MGNMEYKVSIKRRNIGRVGWQHGVGASCNMVSMGCKLGVQRGV